MKTILFTLATLFTLSANAADVKTVIVIVHGESVFNDSTKYEVQYCADSSCEKTFRPERKVRASKEVTKMVMEKVAKSIRRKIYQAGLEIDGWNLSPASLDDVGELLMTDHSQGDGSRAWHQHELEDLFEYIYRDGELTKTWFMPIMSNYMSGTGIETNVLLYAAKTGWVTVINKFEYAE